MRPLAPLLTALALSCALPAASAQRLLDFAQIDASSASSTVVLVRALGEPRAADPAPLASFNLTRWSDGRAASAGLVMRWPLYRNAGHSGSFGAGVGVNHHRSDAPGDAASETRASARLQAEAGGPAPAGRYYTLLQASSFRDSWFVTAQYDPTAWPLALEWSRYGERGYHASTTTLRVVLGDGGWSLRIGSVRDDDGRRAVFGVGYNGF